MSQKAATWDWNTVTLILRLYVILKTLTLTGQEFLEVYEKVEITEREVRAIELMMINDFPVELLQEMC